MFEIFGRLTKKSRRIFKLPERSSRKSSSVARLRLHLKPENLSLWNCSTCLSLSWVA